MRPKDIDGIYRAVRGRMGAGSGTVGAQGPPGPPGPKAIAWRGAWTQDANYSEGNVVYQDTAGSSRLTYVCKEDHTAYAGTAPAPGGTTYWHEVSPGYLIIDGSRPMTGDLDHNGHDAADVRDLLLTGAAGNARVAGARRIQFDTATVPGTDHTLVAGDLSWHNADFIKQLAAVASGDNGNVVIYPGAGCYMRAVAGGTAYSAFQPCRFQPGVTTPVLMTAQGASHMEGFAITLQAIPANGYGWICVWGLVVGLNLSGYSMLAYINPTNGTLTQSRPPKHYVYEVTRAGIVLKAANPGAIFWCPEQDRPLGNANDADFVKNFFDVPMYIDDGLGVANNGWLSRPASWFPVASYSTNATAQDRDVYVAMSASSGASVTYTLPQRSAVVGRSIRVQKIDPYRKPVIIDGFSTDTIQGALTFELRLQWESVWLQADNTEWRIL